MSDVENIFNTIFLHINHLNFFLDTFHFLHYAIYFTYITCFTYLTLSFFYIFEIFRQFEIFFFWHFLRFCKFLSYCFHPKKNFSKFYTNYLCFLKHSFMTITYILWQCFFFFLISRLRKRYFWSWKRYVCYLCNIVTLLTV